MLFRKGNRALACIQSEFSALFSFACINQDIIKTTYGPWWMVLFHACRDLMTLPMIGKAVTEAALNP